MTYRQVENLFRDNPHMVGRAFPSNWQLWQDYLEPRGLLAPNTEPCTCRYCRMTEEEVEAYRKAMRRMYGGHEE